jgi:DNA-binding CsgD family transcriptional regulator
MPDIDDDALHLMIGEIYDVAIDPAKWASLLGRWSKVFGDSGVLLYRQDPSSSYAHALASADIDFAQKAPFEQYYSKLRPWVANIAKAKDGEIRSIFDWIDEQTYRKCAYYAEFLTRLDHHYGISSNLRRDDNVITALTLSRRYGTGDFTPRERQLMKHLVRHLQRALQMQRQFFDAGLRQDALLRGFDRLKIGVVLAAYDGRVLFTNRVADDIFRRDHALRIQRQHLKAVPPALDAELQRRIQEAARTGAKKGRDAGGILSLPCRGGGQVSMLVCPFPIDTASIVGPTVPTALIFVGAPEPSTPVRERDLGRLYGLTPAESKLVAALLEGMSLGDYAQMRGVGLATAKTQLRHAFDKTGQNRQADLVRHILSNSIVRLAPTDVPSVAAHDQRKSRDGPIE